MHAFVAWKGGDPTAYHGGQVSLSPIPHIRREPIGMLVVPLLTSLTQGWAMGWASAPYDPVWAERHPQRAALMAAAGPAGNFMIAAAVFVLIKIGLMAGFFIAPASANFSRVIVSAAAGDANFTATMLSVLLMLNVLLGIFNLLPLPPLDGGSVFSIFLPEDLGRKLRELQANGSFSMIGLLVAWRVFPYLTDPIFTTVLKLVHPGSLLRVIDPFFKQWAKPGPVPPGAMQPPDVPGRRVARRDQRTLPHLSAEGGPPLFDRRRADRVVRHGVGADCGTRARSRVGDRVGGDDCGVAAAGRALRHRRGAGRQRPAGAQVGGLQRARGALRDPSRRLSFARGGSARTSGSISCSAARLYFPPWHRHRRRPPAEGGVPVRAARRHR